jgi:lipopolysaccharide heptosyltransferase II
MFIPNKTLVIRFSSIGDIVLSSPLIRVLRAQFPSSQIDFVVRKEYAELVRYNPHLNIIYEYDVQTGLRGLRQLKKRIRSEKYDLVVDIHNSLRSRYLRSCIGANNVGVVDKRIFARTMLVKFKKNIYKAVVPVAERYIEPVKSSGIENDAQGLEIFIPDETMFKVSGKMSSLKLHTYKKVIGFCPSAKHVTKRWPEERFIETGIRLVNDLKAKILIFGGKNDSILCSSIANAINKNSESESAVEFSRQFSLLETSAAMQFCDVVLSNDSGLMHIAAAMKRKIVALFGSTVEEFGFYPIGTESIILERKKLKCRPCSHIGRDSCPKGHFRCMKEIQVDEVVDSIRAISSRD